MKKHNAVVVFHFFKRLIIEIKIKTIIIEAKNVRLVLMNLAKITPNIYIAKIIGSGLITFNLISEELFFIGHKLNL